MFLVRLLKIKEDDGFFFIFYFLLKVELNFPYFEDFKPVFSVGLQWHRGQLLKKEEALFMLLF